MAQTFIDLQKQIEALQQQAEVLRQEELTGVIARIKEAISHYGLTAEQLGLKVSTSARGRAAAIPRGRRAIADVKFADGDGGIWGGRGPRPLWLRMALDAGKRLEDFAVSAEAPLGKGGASAVKKAARSQADGLKKRAKSVSGGKRAAGKERAKPKVTYRDEAGNSWSGLGPKPKWLKDAIAGGRSLAELVAS